MKNLVLADIVGVGIYSSSVSAVSEKMSKKRKTTMFELELPIEEGGVSYVDSDFSYIMPNMLICSKPGQTRHTRFPFKCYYIHMIIDDGYLYDLLCGMPNFIETDKGDVYKKLFEKMCRYYDTGIEKDGLILQSILLEILYKISEELSLMPKHEKTKGGNYLIIERVLRYIKENLTEDLSLNRMSDMVSLSPVHFHNCFKRSVGKTLHEYVNEQRINRAVNLLISTDKNLTEIAFECGFSSQSYFSCVFKQRMGATPREYAKMINDRYDI